MVRNVIMYFMFIPHSLFIIVHLTWLVYIRPERSKMMFANNICSLLLIMYIFY